MSREPGAPLRLHRAPEGLLSRAVEGARRRRESRRLGLGAALLLLLGWGGGWAHHALHAPDEPAAEPLASATEVLDLRAPGARSVAVAGSWNQWQATPMMERDGTFFTVLRLPPGRYEYMFVIDGQRWVPDPDAPLSRDDGFGQRNSILDL